jgi:DnaJ-class molecular chaperone
LLEEVRFSWHETLGVLPNAPAGAIRRAWARLAHAHHPDKGGTQEQMVRLNAAYERAGRPQTTRPNGVLNPPPLLGV